MNAGTVIAMRHDDGRRRRRTDDMTAAGDLSWQFDPARPPACRVPGGLTQTEQTAHHARWDSAGTGRISSRDWARILDAREVCLSCPVRSACLLWALDPDHRAEGVWGGEYFPASGVRNRLDPDGWRVPVTRPARRAAA